MAIILQMTWQPSLVKSLKRRQGLPPLGLRNLGNSCYLNSVLQCLTFTPPLANFCLRFSHSSVCDFGAGKEKKGDCPFCMLEKRIARSLNSEAVSDAPLKINSCLRIYAEHFSAGRQEDAHEFLRFLIDACNKTCLRVSKLQQQQQQRGKTGTANREDVSESVESVVEEIFAGELQSQVKCLSCGTESNKTDGFMDISLDILNCGSLKEALQKFFQPEVLDGNNKYSCDSCKKLVAARKQMSILQAPNVLVIQLKRFASTLGGKVNKSIAFDEILVLSSYMCKGSKDQHPQYNLVGTIVHSGFSPDSGHYYAYIKDANGRWYCCNDSNVSVSTLHEVLSEKVYMLFFSRTKQRPRRVDVVVNGSMSHESNGSKTYVTQTLGSLDKSGSIQLLSSQQPETNKSTSGTRSCNGKSGCLEKPVNIKIAADFSETNDSTMHVAAVGTNTSPAQWSGLVQTQASMNELAADPSKKYNSLSSVVPSCSNSIEVQLGAHVEPVDIKVPSNDRVQTSNSMKSEVERLLPDKDRRFSDSVIANKLLPSGNIKITVYKKASSEEKGYAADIVGSNNSCMKRKIDDGLKCIFLARDNQSRAEVEAFKEVIGKEASVVLRSCGWSNEVQSFMHARKRLCQEAGNTTSNDSEMKNLLISHAKRNFISKVPESLKASLIECLRLFSQEKQSSGT